MTASPGSEYETAGRCSKDRRERKANVNPGHPLAHRPHVQELLGFKDLK